MRLQGWEWIIILAIVLLLWGAPKFPALAKSAAQSMRIFKKEINKNGEAAAPSDSETAKAEAPSESEKNKD
jgi:sec-independent protein translocase protein TatA